MFFQHTPAVKPFTSLNLTLSQIHCSKQKNIGVNPQPAGKPHPSNACTLWCNSIQYYLILARLVSVPFFNIFGVCSIFILFLLTRTCGDSTTVLKLNPLLGFQYLLLLHWLFTGVCSWNASLIILSNQSILLIAIPSLVISYSYLTPAVNVGRI